MDKCPICHRDVLEHTAVYVKRRGDYVATDTGHCADRLIQWYQTLDFASQGAPREPPTLLVVHK